MDRLRIGQFIAFAAVAALTYSYGSVQAQDAPRMARSVIRVSGEATVTANPDQAQINIGVTTQHESAQQAASLNAGRTTAVLEALKSAVPDAEIKTVSYSLSPNYRYPRDGGQPTISGYTASNIVQVKLNKVDEVGKVIDAATTAGANTIHSIQFRLKDEDEIRNRAIAEAAKKARVKADFLASALGVSIERILSIEEGGPTIVPVIDRSIMLSRAEAAAPTPVEPGTIDVRAIITMTVEFR